MNPLTSRTHSLKRPARRLRRKTRPALEGLEGRRLLSGGGGPPQGISLNAYGTLNIIGDSRYDSAVVSIVNNAVSVTLDQTTYVNIPGLPPKGIKESHAATYPLAGVKSIYFYGDAGGDTFINNTTLPSGANGGIGGDSLVGGFGNDSLYGGDGNDTLEGRAGDDLLKGNAGNDYYVFAGSKLGSDVINETANLDVDTLDFLDFKLPAVIGLPPRPLGVTIDLSKLGPQTVNPGNLVLDLGNSTAIENVNGGNAADVVTGNGRNNQISGNGGADSIHGGEGGDSLFGGAGNDVAYGDGGNDVVNGGANDDSLSGGSGVDTVYGGDGNDALYGGAGVDYLYGQGGVDRFLQQKHVGGSAEDNVGDLTSNDAVITFADQPNGNVAFGWKWSGGMWTDAEVMDVNDALGSLVARIGKPTLLKTANGGPLTYSRYGVPTDQVDKTKDKPTGVGAWNNGAGLNFPDATFAGQKNWMIQIVQHETGHNWNPSGQKWTDWLALSGWKVWDGNSYDTTKYAKTTNYGETWLYLKSAKFANTYGKTHPYEDFATAFEDYFAHYEGRAFIGQLDEVPDKFAFLDAMFNKM